MAALRLPVVALGAEYLVMGHLMRRNILAYKAPPNNEGYDLIAIHSNPRYKTAKGEVAQVRVQVKSRYATDSNRTIIVRAAALSAFDFLIVALLNIGRFYRGSDGGDGDEAPVFYTLPVAFVRKHHIRKGWEKLALQHLSEELAPFEGAAGFELVATALGVARPRRI